MASHSENPHITVVGPDDKSAVPVPIDSINSTMDSYHLSPLGSPDSAFYDSTSTGGYSSPDTPFNDPLDLNFFDPKFPGEGYSRSLTVSVETNTPYSPSTLSPFLGDMSLGEASNPGHDLSSLSGPYDNHNSGLGLNPSDLSMNPGFDGGSASPSRALSPLIIPQNLMSPQPSVDGDTFFHEIFAMQELGHSPYLDSTLNIQTGYTAPSDGTLGSSIHRRHVRHTSEINTPWTGMSPSIASPSFTLTPSEASNSATSLLSPYGFHEDNVVLAEVAAVMRRHSHSGAHGRGGGPDRGRSEMRTQSSSANSSRRSSPYPSSHLGASPISPPQMYGPNDLLSVPIQDNVEGLKRRHSFSGVRATANPAEISVSPIITFEDSSAGSSKSRQVASQAGITASAARRTKDAKYSCELCHQTFTTNHNLKNHMNAHWGVKEHQCPDCARSFTTQSVLARHIKTCKVAKAKSDVRVSTA